MFHPMEHPPKGGFPTGRENRHGEKKSGGRAPRDVGRNDAGDARQASSEDAEMADDNVAPVAPRATFIPTLLDVRVA